MSLLIPRDEFDLHYHNIVRVCGMWTRFVMVPVDRIYSLYELIMLRDGIWMIETGAETFLNKYDS
jgi:hypothetical protein